MEISPNIENNKVSFPYSQFKDSSSLLGGSSQLPAGSVAKRLERSREKAGSADQGSEASLLYLYSNICTESSNSVLQSETLDALTSLLTPYHKRSAHTLRTNAERLLQLAPSIAYLGFLTLTFKENITDSKEASKRFKSFNSHFLSKSLDFKEWLSVRERQARGAWHYHILILLAHDIRSGFEWSLYDIALKLRRPDYPYLSSKNALYRKSMKKAIATASPVLKRLWREIRVACDKYGFGRSEMLPIKSNIEVMSKYVGKYISKEFSLRNGQDKGVRLVNSSQGWLKNSVKFAWYTEGSKEWRRKLMLFARINKCNDLYDLTQKLGSSWAFKYVNEINTIDSLIEETGIDIENIEPDKIASPWLNDFIKKREKFLILKQEEKIHDCPVCKRKASFRFDEENGFFYCLRCGGEIF